MLLALGYTREQAMGTLRLSLGRHTTDAEIDAACEAIPPIVARLRAMHPNWQGRTAAV